ncbi:hypothetical protein H0H93_015503, partial [Arthromyces matolae]
YPPRAGRAAASSIEALAHDVGRLVVPEMPDLDDQAPVGPGCRQEVGQHSRTLAKAHPVKDGIRVEQTRVFPGHCACDRSFLPGGEHLPHCWARQYAITEDARPVGTAPRVPAVVMEHDDHVRYHAFRTYLNDIDGASAHGPIPSHSGLNVSCCSVRAIHEDNELPRRRSGGLGHPLRPYLDMDTENKVESLQHTESMSTTGTYQSPKVNVAQPELDVDDEEQEHLIFCELSRCLELRSKLELQIRRLQEYIDTREPEKAHNQEVPKSSTPLEKESNEDNDMSMESMMRLDLMDAEPSGATDAMPCRGTAPVPDLILTSRSKEKDDHCTSNRWSSKISLMVTGTPMRMMRMNWTRKKSRLKDKEYIQKSMKLRNEFTGSEGSEQVTSPMVFDVENEAQDLSSKCIADSYNSCSPSRRTAPALVIPDWLVPQERLPPVLLTEDMVRNYLAPKGSMTKLNWKRETRQHCSSSTPTIPDNPSGHSKLLKVLSMKHRNHDWLNEHHPDGEDLRTVVNDAQARGGLLHVPEGTKTVSYSPSEVGLTEVCCSDGHTRKRSMTRELDPSISRRDIANCGTLPIRIYNQLQIGSKINHDLFSEAMSVYSGQLVDHSILQIDWLIAPGKTLDSLMTYVMTFVQDRNYALLVSGVKPNEYDGNTIEVTDRRSLSCLKVHSLLSWAFPAMDKIPNDNGIGVDRNAAVTSTLVMTLESDLIVHVRNIRIQEYYESNPYLWMLEAIQLRYDLLMLNNAALKLLADPNLMNTINDFPSGNNAPNSQYPIDDTCATKAYQLSASLNPLRRNVPWSYPGPDSHTDLVTSDRHNEYLSHVNENNDDDCYSEIYEYISSYEQPESEIYSPGYRIDYPILLYMTPVAEDHLDKMILVNYWRSTSLIFNDDIQIRNKKELTSCGRRHIVDLEETINRWNPSVTWALSCWPLTHYLMLKIQVSEDIRTRSQPQPDPVAWKEKKLVTLVSKADPMLKNGWRLDPQLRAPTVAGIRLIITCEFASVDGAMSMDIKEVLTFKVVDHAHNRAEPTDGWKIPIASVVCRWPHTRLQSCKSNVMLDRRLRLQPQLDTPWYGRQLTKNLIKSFVTLCLPREDDLIGRLSRDGQYKSPFISM